MEKKTTELATLSQRGLLKREAAAEGLQYLTFSLAGEEYGVDILKVQEIRGWGPVTKVPNAPAFVRGVMNLRGAIVPVSYTHLDVYKRQVRCSAASRAWCTMSAPNWASKSSCGSTANKPNSTRPSSKKSAIRWCI